MPEDRFLTPDEAAGLLRLRATTLANWRSTRTGPPYRKAGARVLYAEHELRRWLDAQTRLAGGDRAA